MFISKIALKNFKSFSNSSLVLEKGVNALVGPNGCGKSNVIDSLLFAFGETSLKSMRVKRTRDLINGDHGVAEVAIELKEEDGGQEQRIERLVRKDGKTKYRLNGKRVKKYVVEEFLGKHAFFTTTIIKQGEVQRIVEMSGKERRGLIDYIANISEYEDKKAEALQKLSEVEQKVREHQAIFREKQGYLEELKKQKEDAEKHVSLKKEFDSLKATLLSIEVKWFEQELEKTLRGMLEYKSQLDALVEETGFLAKKIGEKSLEKDEVNKQIIQKGEAKQVVLQNEIQELEAGIDSARRRVEEEKKRIFERDSRLKGLGIVKGKAEEEVKGIERQLKDSEGELLVLEKLLQEEQSSYAKLLDQSKVFSSKFYEAKKILEQSGEEMLKCKEQLNGLQSEVSLCQDKKRLKENELNRLKLGVYEDYSQKKKDAEKRILAEQKNLEAIAAELEKAFSQEKELQERLQVLEDLSLLAKEKTAETEARLRALQETDFAKTMDEVLALKGVHGTIESLCRYDARFETPVQVALGARLNYVVVDSVSTARKAIELLKERKLGRVSFIPLDKIVGKRIEEKEKELKKEPGAIDFLIELLDFDSKYGKAFEFVCGNTLVMRTLRDCEPLIGRTRMVSLEGDLVEERGLLTGGHFVERMNVFKERKALGEWSKKLADSEEGRQKTSLELNSLAKKLGELRKKKAEQEIRVREAELESRYLAQEEQSVLEKRKNISAEVKLLEQEIRELNKLVEERDEERAALVRKLSELNVRMLDAKQEVDVEREQTLGMKVKEAERKMGDLRIRISQYQSAISSLNAQHAAYEREIMSYDSQEKEATHEISDAKNLLKELDLKIKEDLRVLEEKMREQKNVSRELQDLIEARDKIERELQKYGNEKGRLEFRREELVQKNQKEELSKVAVETKLADLKAEFEALSGASVLEGKAFGDKPALNARLIQVERELNEIGPVNLKALELYEEKEVELKQQMQKVDLLLNEKNAILAMIQEIDGKKEDTFMNSFNAVNENFQKLFGYIFLGRGTLFLENLNEAGEKKPFGDWGLTIQLQLENKEVKYLELMSGGEKALIALLFLFALQMSGASAVYIFDEADAALDEENSAKFASLLKRIAQQSQVLIVTHNETVFKQADCLIGIAMGREGSKLVEVKLGGLA